jgi:serine/threonine protein phosphatase PrpC
MAIVGAIAEANATCSAKWPQEGTCAALVVMLADVMWTANVGDSRVVLIRRNTARRMTYDHKASDPDERRMVIARGGHVVNDRVNGVLMLARAIGDGNLGNAVSCDPHIERVDRKDGSFLLIACDGVWDVMEDQEAADILIAASTPLKAARKIRDEALRRGSTDNVSVMVVNLTPTE